MNEASGKDVGSSHSVTFLGEFSKKLATNTFFNFVGRFWSFVVTLLLTPYILSRLSVTEFGVWVLLSVFVSSFNLLDLGLGSSFTKYVSQYHARRDDARINLVLFSGLLFYSVFGLGLVGVGVLLEPFLFAVFKIETVPGVFLLVLVSFALNNIALMLVSTLKGLQRMDQSNAVEIWMSVPNLVGTVLFLEAGMGMFGLAIHSVVLALLTLVAAWRRLRRVHLGLSISWRFDPAFVREMFGYGAKLQVSRLGGLVCFQIDKLIISRFLGVAAVSFYEVASRLILFMRALPLVMISALIPATSELGARNDRARILKAYLLASKYVVMLSVALVAFVILEADSLLRLWLGNGFEQSVILVQVLAIGYGVNVMGGAASQTGAGVGRPEFDMKGTILLTVLNPILSLLLVREFGAAGAAAGTSLALIVAAGYLLILFHRDYLGDRARTIIRDVHVRPWASGIIASVSVWGLHLLLPPLVDIAQVRYLIPVKIAADLVVFTVAYVALLVGFRHVTAIDWKNFTGLVSFGFEFVRHPLRERVKIYR